VEAVLRGLNEALVKERTRQGGEIKEPQISSDPEAERLVKDRRRRQFLDTPPWTDKVQ